MSKIQREISGAVNVDYDGAKVSLRLTLQALALFEEQPNSGRMSARTFRALAWALMVDAQPDITLAEVGRMIGADGLELFSPAVAEAIRVGFGQAGAGEPTTTPAVARGKVDWWLMWSFARHDLRLGDEEFWRLTPRQFSALAERHAAAYERDLARSALICATLANIHRDSDKHPEAFSPADFMPHLTPRGGDEQTRKLAEVKRLQAKVLGINAILGGRTKAAPGSDTLRLPADLKG